MRAVGGGAGGDGHGSGHDGGHGGSGGGYAPEDDGRGGFKWWPWLLLAAGLLLLFLLLRSCHTEPAPAGGVDTNTTADANMAGMDMGAGDMGNSVDDALANGAAPAPAPTGAGVVAEYRVGLPMLNVYFDTGQSAVHNDLATASAAVKAYVDSHPGTTLAVSGFNDPTGNAAANAELSKKRAQAVKAALEATGIAADRIVLEKPAETTAADADMAQARRVEVTIRQ